MSRSQTMKRLRKRILTLAHKGGDANLQSVMSSLDILWVLYDRFLGLTPGNRRDPNRNYFVLSKGQATLGQFAILEEKGFFAPSELDTFGQLRSRFSMIADRTKFDGGIETSAGSLGHGFPMAAGAALAAKIQGSPSMVYTLAGDGEFNEGTMWEAALLAGYKKLDNLCVIIDDNRSIGVMLDMGDMARKLEAFGFTAVRADGHDHAQLAGALGAPRGGKPLAVIAATRRGWGSKTLMEDSRWFHRAPDAAELVMLLEEVDLF